MQQAFGFQRGQRFIPTAKAEGFRAVFCGKERQYPQMGNVGQALASRSALPDLCFYTGTL